MESLLAHGRYYYLEHLSVQYIYLQYKECVNKSNLHPFAF